VSNPNAPKKKKTTFKASELDPDAPPVELSRREREAIEAQRANDLHWKLTEQGKTEEAQSDLARLRLIRQQREEAAKKRAEEGGKTPTGPASSSKPPPAKRG